MLQSAPARSLAKLSSGVSISKGYPCCCLLLLLLLLYDCWVALIRDVFTAGASHYGVADVELLAKDTHKFESRWAASAHEVVRNVWFCIIAVCAESARCGYTLVLTTQVELLANGSHKVSIESGVITFGNVCCSCLLQVHGPAGGAVSSHEGSVRTKITNSFSRQDQLASSYLPGAC